MTSLMFLLGWAWLAPIAADEPLPDHPMRVRMLADIQSAIDAQRLSIWRDFDRTSAFSLWWRPAGFSEGVRFRRAAQRSPDHTLMIMESWTMNPDDLGRLCRIWGHPDEVKWENLLGEIPEGRVVASVDRGELLIVRDYPADADHTRIEPFGLEGLPTAGFPNGSADPDDPFTEPEERSRFASFMADIFLEELEDRDGIPISISKTWHFEGRFSRFSPGIRFERRIRLDFGGEYRIFDVFTLGTEFLLGDRVRGGVSTETVEQGALLSLEKRVVVIHGGYRTWHKALFAKVFTPRRLPYTPEKMRELPMGVRVIFPSTTGLTLVERRKRPSSLGDKYPFNIDLFAGMQGTFFVSVAKHTPEQIDLRFGGRIERMGEINFKLRPDFDGAFDPLRLVMGSLWRLRTGRTYGTRLTLQRFVDVEDDEQLELVQKALRRGLRFNGLALGASSILNLSFYRRVDLFLVDQFIAGKLPEIEWERSVIGQYRDDESYHKFGLRLASARSNTIKIKDDWEIEDLDSEEITRGKSISYTKRNTKRLLSYIDQRTLQLRGFFDKNDQDEDGQAQFLEVVDLYDQTKLSWREYRSIVRRFQRCLGPNDAAAAIGDWPQRSAFKEARIGYRLILNQQAIDTMTEIVLGLPRGETHPLKRWFRFHPILKRKIRRHRDDPEKQFVNMSNLVYKLARSRGPFFCLMRELPRDSYYLTWRAQAQDVTGVRGEKGAAPLPETLMGTWREWERMGVLDQIFVDRNFNTRLD